MSGLRSSLARFHPRRPLDAREIDDMRRAAWHHQGVVAIREDDQRLSWVEREQLKAIAVRLYGQRGGQ